MSDIYEFNAGSAEYVLHLSQYESKLLSRLGNPAYRTIFAPIRRGAKHAIPLTTLQEDTSKLLNDILNTMHLLAFRYALTTRGMPDGKEHRGEGGFGCRFCGRLAIVEAGAGFCQINAVEVGRFTGAGEKLADLRDLRPVQLDGGVIVTATRRSRPFSIADQLTELEIFLRKLTSEEVIVSLR